MHASQRRQYFCSTTAASTRLATAAARRAAFLPASVVRLKCRRVSHMRAQLWMMVALWSLQEGTGEVGSDQSPGGPCLTTL